MDKEDKALEERKKKVRSFFSKPTRTILILIVLFAFLLRVYFFVGAGAQTYWWDESEYMSTAKSWAFGVPYDVNHQRPPLFQLLGSIFLMLGLGERAIQFLIVVLPSVLVVLATYWLGKELFNEKVGLIAAFGTATMWSFLFWSTRFQPDFFSISFQLLGFLFYFRAMKQKNLKFAAFAGFFAALGFYFKISSLLVPMALFIFVFINEGFSFVKNKVHWVALSAYVITFLPFMIWQFLQFGNPLSFAPSYASTSARAGRELGWGALNYYYNFLASPSVPIIKAPLFWLMIVGIVFLIYKLAISFDLFLKKKERRFKGEILSIVVLALLAWYFIFFTKGTIEDRWIFLIAPFLFYFAADTGLKVARYLNKYYKNIGTILLILTVILAGYWQIQHASALIDVKKGSYYPVQDASLFIKKISAEDESIESISLPQVTAYSERKTHSYSEMSDIEFTEYLKEEMPDYYMISIFEPHPNWAFQQQRDSSGNTIWAMPYSESMIKISPQGQVIEIDVKQKFEKDNVEFNLIYPSGQINGAFVYKISYN